MKGVAQDTAQKAAEALQRADRLIITAGAGMGVDSGLPDFRGDRGFWKSYPMYERLGINFVAAANPELFERDPAFGWGFYGHRSNLYRQTVPHEGFRILKGWIERFSLESFVVTSNVDGQFQKAGFDKDQSLEVHGSIHRLQCCAPCSNRIWANEAEFDIDLLSMRSAQLPKCPCCGGTARPNILMFGDYAFIANRYDQQQQTFTRFNQKRGAKTLVIELGAGTAVPTIRHLSESLGRQPHTTVVRINPREPQIGSGHLSLPCGALEGLGMMDEALGYKRR